MSRQTKSEVGGRQPIVRTVKWAKGNDEGGKFVDRNLTGVKGFAAQNQFAPTPAVPVRQRFKMGGGC